MSTKKELFTLPTDIHYLNCAYMSPLLRSVQEAGIEGVRTKGDPSRFDTAEMYTPAEAVREKFATLIGADVRRIAIIPAVSYGIQSAVNNIPPGKGDHLLIISEEFPSDYHPAERWCRTHGKKLVTVEPPEGSSNRGAVWNESLLGSINSRTAAVIMSPIHWTDGTIFDLAAVGTRCRDTDTLLIVDGSQTVGAMPIDVAALHVDALVCACYKWLLGPYGIGLAYFGEAFDAGIPIEEAWVNRLDALSASGSRDYSTEYNPGAGRYNVGQYGNLILLPMVNEALEHVLNFQRDDIEGYCRDLMKPAVSFLREQGHWIEDDANRAHHLFGFRARPGVNRDDLITRLKEKKVFVSARGKGIRVSPYLYNKEEDVHAFIEALS